MKHMLCLVIIPEGADPQQHAASVLDKWSSAYPVKLLLGYDQDARFEGKLTTYAETLEPFPRHAGWEVGGYFAGVLLPTSKQFELTPDTMKLVENNLIACAEVPDGLPISVLVDVDEQWYVNRSTHARELGRIRQVLKHQGTLRALLVHLKVSQNCEQNGLIY